MTREMKLLFRNLWVVGSPGQNSGHEAYGLWLLGGSWDVVTTYKWACNHTYSGGNPHQTSWGDHRWGYKPHAPPSKLAAAEPSPRGSSR